MSKPAVKQHRRSLVPGIAQLFTGFSSWATHALYRAGRSGSKTCPEPSDHDDGRCSFQRHAGAAAKVLARRPVCPVTGDAVFESRGTISWWAWVETAHEPDALLRQYLEADRQA